MAVLGSTSLLAADAIKVYADRLAKLPTTIEMTCNEQVQQKIDFYVEKNKEQVEQMLGLSQYYFPIFEQELAAAKLPVELKYIAVIESALNADTIARADAAGLWQLTSTTGRIYGLEKTEAGDDRLNPYKSTKASIAYFRDLYTMFGDWHLAIAAYHSSPGKVQQAIRHSGGKQSFWEIYDYLPQATRDYLPTFIAANYIMTYYKEHNLTPAKVSRPEGVCEQNSKKKTKMQPPLIASHRM